jgi:ribosomal protein S18 acetylase RimI-like enzyme
VSVAIRPARIEDAEILAELVNQAGEGLPLHVWEGMAAPGETGWDVGRRRARRDEGAFSWRNALVLDAGDGAIGCLIGYPLDLHPSPVGVDVPPLFRPLEELEAEAPGTWYINVIAVLPEERGRGHGVRLIEAARERAAEAGRAGLSLIVADTNAGARRFYEREGFATVAERPLVWEPGWGGPGRRWLLMTRPL